MITTFHHLFYLKKPKGFQNGPASIYLRITVNGKRAEVSLNLEVLPDKWIAKAGKMKGNTEEVRKFNNCLDNIRAKLYDAYQELIRTRKPITAELLKNHFTGNNNNHRWLIPIFEKHNKEMEALLSKEFAEGTLKKYKTTLNHISYFLKWRYNSTDIELSEIDHQFITDFDFFLRSQHSCANNTTVKYLKNFEKIIKLCLHNDWLDISWKQSFLSR